MQSCMTLRTYQLEVTDGGDQGRILTQRNNMMQFHFFNPEAPAAFLTTAIARHPFLTLDAQQFLTVLTKNLVMLISSLQPIGADVNIHRPDFYILTKTHSLTVYPIIITHSHIYVSISSTISLYMSLFLHQTTT